MPDIYTGRLACDGDGNLLADQSTNVGEKTVKVFDETGAPVLDESGEQREITFAIFEYGPQHGITVAHEPGTGYVVLADGDARHNARHHKGFAQLTATTEPLYNAAGELVYAGDAHHDEPTPDDPHYDAGAPGKTRLTFDEDAVAVVVTGHTQAYA